MYPDTDSAPIPLTDQVIEEIRKSLPTEVTDRYQQLQTWGVAESTYTFIFKRNYYPVIESISTNTDTEPRWVGNFIGHWLKWVESHYEKGAEFNPGVLESMIQFLKKHKLDLALAYDMLPVVYQYPKMDLDSVLTSINFKAVKKEEITEKINFLNDKFSSVKISDTPENRLNWIMGQLLGMARGNLNLTELHNIVKQKIS